MTGFFVLSVDTEDPIEPRSRHTRWNAIERRVEGRLEEGRVEEGREATRRFMRLLDGHALPATWVVGETAVLEAWGRRRSDGGAPRDSLVGAVTSMATRQEIAVSPSRDGAAPADDARLARCTQFAEWDEYEVRTVALPDHATTGATAGATADIARYAAFGFTACRRTPPATRPSPLTDDLFQRPLPMWRPSDLGHAGSILMVPVSLSLASLDNRRRLVPEAARIARVRKGLERAASEGAMVHLAFQLADLEHSESLFRTVEDILFHVAEARAGGALQVATVAGLRRVQDAETRGRAPRRAA